MLLNSPVFCCFCAPRSLKSLASASDCYHSSLWVVLILLVPLGCASKLREEPIVLGHTMQHLPPSELNVDAAAKYPVSDIPLPDSAFEGAPDEEHDRGRFGIHHEIRRTHSGLHKAHLKRRAQSASASSPSRSSYEVATSSSADVDVQSPMPSAFDRAVPTDFESTNGDTRCPNFIFGLLSNAIFKSCYPISMLFQTSMGFFEAQKKLVSIVRVLDASCRADVATCTNFFEDAAQQLMSEANCKTEIDWNQPLVLQAWRGLKAYKMLYTATCLQDPTSNMYCFANAVTNLSTPSDTYLYFMPYGLPLPGASVPSCNWCTRRTMELYDAASADRRQFVAAEYVNATLQINTICGPDFVNSSLPAAVIGSDTSRNAPRAASSLLALILFTSAFVLAT